MRAYAAAESVSRRADLGVLGRPVAGAEPLSACLIGCGGIAETHLEILRRMPNARVVGLCDANPDAARAMAERFDVPEVFTDAREMVEKLHPDVVHILTPPQSHAAYAETAARAGCNVLVEKPMAMDAAEGARMAEVARECGVRLCVDHNHLYDPTMVRARRMIESGALGDLVWVESYYGFNLGDNPASRYMAPGGEKHWCFELPGGFYQNLAPHPLCLALEALGEPTRISAHARYGRVLPHAPTDELRVMLETESASGLVTVSLAAEPALPVPEPVRHEGHALRRPAGQVVHPPHHETRHPARHIAGADEPGAPRAPSGAARGAPSGACCASAGRPSTAWSC